CVCACIGGAFRFAFVKPVSHNVAALSLTKIKFVKIILGKVRSAGTTCRSASDSLGFPHGQSTQKVRESHVPHSVCEGARRSQGYRAPACRVRVPLENLVSLLAHRL